MTHQVEFTEVARGVLIHLPPSVKQGLKEGFRFLSANPFAGEPLRRELEGKRKLKVGRYRIIYQIESSRKTVLVLAIGHRRSVYEEFKRAG